MNVLLLTVPIALFLSLAFLTAFWWATRDGQWDDLDLTPLRTMNDDLQPGEKNERQQANHHTV